METNYPVLCASKPLKPDLEKFQRIPITSDVFKLGRGQQNTIVMPYKCISKDHCIFKKVDEEWILENCSYSSIKINGNKVRKGQKRKLHDQDVIKLENSSEFVYTFNKNSLRKRRKLDEEVRKKETKSSSDKLKEQIMSEQSKKEKQIYNEYASRIENLKGSKKAVKRQKSLLKIRRDTQLKALRAEMEGKMASVPETQQTEPDPSEPKELPEPRYSEPRQESPKQEALYRLRAKIREQDRLRVREKRELRKLRKETEQLRLDKEKKLKEIEKQKLARERELQEELNKLNKKLAKQIELHESEKRRHEQLLKQKKKKEPPPPEDPRLDMEAELQCSICSELFIRATTLGCSHSFCQYCVRKWQQSRPACPICRAPIRSECRSIVLDSLVDKMADASEEGRRQRQELLKARDELEAKEAAEASIRANDTSYRVYEISEYMREYEHDEYENSDSNSSYYGRESSLEPDPELLATDSDSIDFSTENGHSSPEYNSGEESPENYDESPENYDDSPENFEPENESGGDGEETPEYYDEENSRENSEPDEDMPDDEYEPDDENEMPDDENELPDDENEPDEETLPDDNYQPDEENFMPDDDMPDEENFLPDSPSEYEHDEPDYNEVSSPEDGEIEYDGEEWGDGFEGSGPDYDDDDNY